MWIYLNDEEIELMSYQIKDNERKSTLLIQYYTLIIPLKQKKPFKLKAVRNNH